MIEAIKKFNLEVTIFLKFYLQMINNGKLPYNGFSELNGKIFIKMAKFQNAIRAYIL